MTLLLFFKDKFILNTSDGIRHCDLFLAPGFYSLSGLFLLLISVEMQCLGMHEVSVPIDYEWKTKNSLQLLKNSALSWFIYAQIFNNNPDLGLSECQKAELYKC